MKARLLLGPVLFLMLVPGYSAAQAAKPPAGKPGIRITSPSPGETIHSSTVTVHVKVSHFKLVNPVIVGPSKWSSIPLLKGNQGHIHYVLDNPANLVLSRDVVVRTSHTWTDVPPGEHTIIAYLATSQHAPFPAAAPAEVHIFVNPPTPHRVSHQKSHTLAFSPSIRLVASGVRHTRTGTIAYIRVKVSHFKLVAPVYKNPPILHGNQGHIHYVLDRFSNFVATKDATMKMVHPWRHVAPGRHTIIVFLSNSQHQLFPGTSPIRIHITVPPGHGPGGTSTLLITNEPLTGGGGRNGKITKEEDTRPYWLLLLPLAMTLLVLYYLRRHSHV